MNLLDGSSFFLGLWRWVLFLSFVKASFLGEKKYTSVAVCVIDQYSLLSILLLAFLFAFALFFLSFN